MRSPAQDHRGRVAQRRYRLSGLGAHRAGRRRAAGRPSSLACTARSRPSRCASESWTPRRRSASWPTSRAHRAASGHSRWHHQRARDRARQTAMIPGSRARRARTLCRKRSRPSTTLPRAGCHHALSGPRRCRVSRSGTWLDSGPRCPPGCPGPLGKEDDPSNPGCHRGSTGVLACQGPPAKGGVQQAKGRVAQWESARFTRERSQVRNPPRPSDKVKRRKGIAVGTGLRRVGSTRPPHRSQRALLAHWAPALGVGGKSRVGPRVQDAGGW